MMLMHVARSLTTRAGSGFDPATTQWINAVFAVDSTVVTTPQATLVDNLIVGLKADGLFTKLDRLWLFAIENQTEALVDIVADSLATNVNSTTFTADAGFTGNGSSMSIDTNYSRGPNLGPTSATYAVWDVTVTGNNSAALSHTGLNNCWLIPGNDSSTTLRSDIFSTNIDFSIAPEPTGFIAVSRLNSLDIQVDVNGSQITSYSTAVVDNSSTGTFKVMTGSPANNSSGQCACCLMGGALTSTERTNLYTRLRTYMTAVGVP